MNTQVKIVLSSLIILLIIFIVHLNIDRNLSGVPGASVWRPSNNRVIPTNDRTLFVGGSTTNTAEFVVDIWNGIASSSADFCVNGVCLSSASSRATSSLDYWYINTTGIVKTATDTLDYWETTQWRWATTSADYWETEQAARGGSGTGSNFSYDTNYDLTVITPSTTIPVWFKDSVFASSTVSILATTTIGDDLQVNSRIVTVSKGGFTHHVPTGGENSSFMIIDKNNTASDASLLLSDQGALKWEIGTAGDNNLYWKTITGSEGSYAFTNVLKMDAESHRVGIGTEAPSSKLEIATSSRDARVDMRITNKSTSGTDGSSLQLVAENDGHVFYVATDAGLNGGQNAFLNWGSFGTGIFIDSAGKVGIQDTSLTYDFEVTGTTHLTGNATTTGHFVITDGTNGVRIEGGQTTTFAGF